MASGSPGIYDPDVAPLDLENHGLKKLCDPHILNTQWVKPGQERP